MGVYLGRNKVNMLGGTPISLNGTDTADATVTANDLANGVVAYGADGKVVGTVPTFKDGVFSKASNCSVHSSSEEYVSVDLMCGSDALLRSGSGLFYNIDSSRFGNAKKDEVLSGVTFTSSDGLATEGTLVVKEEEIGNYEYTSNGSKTIEPSEGKVFSKVNVNINVPNSGTDTSDATVTSSDLAEGVIAYGANGERIEGELLIVNGGATKPIYRDVNSINVSGTNLQTIFTKGTNTPEHIVREGGQIATIIPLSEFGDATASDVVSGKKFTSSTGLKVTGTHECESGIDMSDATVTPETLANGVIAYGADGRVVGTSTLKMFTWKKYSVIDSTVSGAYSQQEVSDQHGVYLASTQPEIYSSMSFDASTGVFTLSGASSRVSSWSSVYNDKIYQSYPYYYINDAHTKVAKIISMTPPNTGAVVQTYGSTYTEYYSLKNEPYAKDSYIEDVSSCNHTDYPADGYQDGYWYVLEENQPTIVMVTGTTTSSSFDTGLSKINTIMICYYTTSGAGLVCVNYSDALDYITVVGRSSYTTSASHVARSNNSYITVTDGTVSLTGTGNYAFRTNVEYDWVAFGEE